MKDEFGVLLRSYRERRGYSRSRLAHEVGVDPSYCTRFENGDRLPPRQHLIEAMARVMRLSLPERDRLLVSAGFAPISVMLLGEWDDTLQAVVGVLNDFSLSQTERDEFRTLVQTIARRYRPAGPVTIQDKTVDAARLARTVEELLALINAVKQPRGPKRRQYTIAFEKTSVVVTIERSSP